MSIFADGAVTTTARAILFGEKRSVFTSVCHIWLVRPLEANPLLRKGKKDGVYSVCHILQAHRIFFGMTLYPRQSVGGEPTIQKNI